MAGLATVGVAHGGFYILVVSIIIMAYGLLLLAQSPRLDGRVLLFVVGPMSLVVVAILATVGVAHGGFYIVVVSITAFALLNLAQISRAVRRGRYVPAKPDSGPTMDPYVHTAMLLTLGSFFVGLPQEPFIAWAVVPLAFVLSLSIGRVIALSEEDPSARFIVASAAFPPCVLVAVALAMHWRPLWYPAAALAIYSCLLFSPLSSQLVRRQILSEPAGNWTWSPHLHLSHRSRLHLLGSYLALFLSSLGLIVDVSGVSAPSWMDLRSADIFPTVVQALVFLGAAVFGYALPLILFKESDSPEEGPRSLST
jgi:hypothetical protein